MVPEPCRRAERAAATEASKLIRIVEESMMSVQF